MGFLAWRLYEADGAEHSLLRAIVAAILICDRDFRLDRAVARAHCSRAPTLARVLRDSGCAQPVAAAAGYHEPSLVFLAGTATRLTDGAGAAEFLRGGECRFAFVEARQERSFAQRAEAIGLRYTRGPRIEAINISNGQADHDRGLSARRARHERDRRSSKPTAGGVTARLQRLRANARAVVRVAWRASRASRGDADGWRSPLRLGVGALARDRHHGGDDAAARRPGHRRGAARCRNG